MKQTTRRKALALASMSMAGSLLPSPRVQAQDKLLDEVVGFAGTILFLDARVPALILGAVRDGRTAVFGFGETSDGSGKEPDGNTMLRIGSITKAFTGQVLAGLVSQGTVRFTDRLQDRLGWPVKVPERDGRPIRLIELATHTSGLPREVERAPGPPDDPFRTLTQETYIKGLQADPLLFAPGSGGLYSNFAFDLLAAALGSSAGKPYDQLLKEVVLDPAGLKDTVLALRDGDASRVMQGHFFDGKAMPTVRATSVMAGASSLYSTANDILRWLAWHLDRFSPQGTEIRLLDHAAYVPRDGLRPVSGFDDAGHMDAMGLAWIVMAPKGSRPLILQKAGGLQGIFTYSAFAPTRGVGVFAAINQFNVGAFTAMAGTANGLIEQLAPR
ncbi:MAG: D-alanyl-D-alanine-carboxypeptidase/endopeptidase AmpH [Reyranella sp.]|uniref:D-alanyl-D-alanine- carboxypeptidase/endopeptidase AmpH n=1 Tax=Reyranella sp. TaxID=1929291 RepID=UPI003D13A79D